MSGSSAPIITSTSVAPAEQRPLERKGRTDDKDKRDGSMCSQYMPIYDERPVHELLHFNVLLLPVSHGESDRMSGKVSNAVSDRC
jgi:hypothetical protein